jgi:hypothetical protein
VTDAGSTTPALSATTSSNQAGGVAFSGTQKGTGDAAGKFVTENTTNVNPTVYAENRGAGAAVKGAVTTGAGAAVQATTTGTGNAGLFENTNSSNANPTVLITNAGSGNALETAGKVKTGALTATSISAGNVSLGNISAGDVEADAFIGDGSQLTGVAANNLTLPATLNQANDGLSTPALTITNAGTGNAIETTGKIQAGFLIGDGSLLTNVSASPFTFPFNTPQNTATTTFEVTNSGAGGAGSFLINNASSLEYALIGETNGGNLSAGVYGNNTGNGFGVFGHSAGTMFGSAAVYGEHTGTGDAAGAFRISNAASTYSALYGETNGTGTAVMGKQIGTSGRAGWFEVDNPVNTSTAITGLNDGLGSGIRLTLSNASNAAEGVFSTTAGVGKAGSFNITNPANSESALLATTNGTGAAGRFINTNTTNGGGIYVETSSGDDAVTGYIPGGGGNAGVAIAGHTGGTNSGSAFFGLYNSSNTRDAVEVYTGGLGRAGKFTIGNSSNSLAAVEAITSGTGNAGYFNNTNTTSDSSTVFVKKSSSVFTAALKVISNGIGIHGINRNDGLGWGGGWGVYGETDSNILGIGVLGKVTGTVGFAGSFESENPLNAQEALKAYTNGIGNAVHVYVDNVGSSAAAIQIDNSGSGPAINTSGKIQAGQFIGDGSGLTNLPPMSFPFSLTNTDAGDGASLLNLSTNQANAADWTTVASFQNLNPSASSNILTVTNEGAGASVVFTSKGVGTGFISDNTNASNGFAAIRGRSNGGLAIQGVNYSATDGFAGTFINTIATNSYPAIQAATQGTGPGLRVLQDGTSAGGGVDIIIQSTSTTASGLTLNTKGLGEGGSFVIDNTSNNNAALYAETNGTGSAIRATSTGDNWTTLYSGNQASADGHAAYFEITDGANNAAALQVHTIGGGAAGNFSSTGNASVLYANTTGNGAAIHGETSGTGPALQGITSTGWTSIYGKNDGATSGSAGKFEISQTGNGDASILASTNGNGAAVQGDNNGAGLAGQFNSNGSGGGVSISLSNTAGFKRGIDVNHQGEQGEAAVFATSNAANNNAALFAENYGNAGGQAVSAAVHGSGAYTAILGQSHGIGGHGGKFLVNNVSNGADALLAVTYGIGNAFVADHGGASGNIAIFQSGGSNRVRIDKSGNIYHNGSLNSGGADLAEAFEVEGSVTMYEPGDVLVISESTDRTVEKSSSANSRKVVGVYATKPGVLLSEKGIDDDLGNTVPMGVIGVIPTKVCLENGPIKRGDLLVTSSETGKAMKAKPVVIEGIEIYPNGAILGKALENYDGTGASLIKVLVNVK